jgi:glycerol-3-phosphate dehydrogenase (NAD(P)+)
MGDLMATCISPLSRNRTVGELLGRGQRLESILADMRMVAEGVSTAGVVLRLAERYDVDLPICTEISSVIKGEKTALDAYRGLRMDAGHESDPG